MLEAAVDEEEYEEDEERRPLPAQPIGGEAFDGEVDAQAAEGASQAQGEVIPEFRRLDEGKGARGGDGLRRRGEVRAPAGEIGQITKENGPSRVADEHGQEVGASPKGRLLFQIKPDFARVEGEAADAHQKQADREGKRGEGEAARPGDVGAEDGVAQTADPDGEARQNA